MAIQLSREGLRQAYECAGIDPLPAPGLSYSQAKKRVQLLEVGKLIVVDGCRSETDDICDLCVEGAELCLMELRKMVKDPKIPRTQADNLTMNVKPYQQPVH